MKIRLRSQHLVFVFLLSALLWAPRGFLGADAKPFAAMFDVVIIGLFAFAVAARPIASRTQVVAIALILYLGMRGVDSNVPGWDLAYLGFRKSVFFLMAVYVGYSLACVDVKRLSGTLLVIGLLMLAVAVRQYWSWSSFDDRLLESVAADASTHHLLGQRRSVGLFSSPFTLGMLGAALMSVAFVLDGRISRVAAVVVGAGLIGLSLTRVNFVAGATALTIGYAFSRWDRLRALKLSVLLVSAIIGASFFFDDLAQGMVANLDQRLIGRLDSWQGAGAAFGTHVERIVYGFGLGSAGDTLGERFAGGWHITSHNVFLKYMFEGGAIAVVLFSAMLGFLVRSILRAPPALRAAGMALVGVFLVNGLTGGTVDAMPAAAFMAILMGGIAAAGDDRGAGQWYTAMRQRAMAEPAGSRA